MWLGVWLGQNAFHHSCELVSVFGADILKLQTSSDTRQDVAYSSFGDDSAIFDKKVEFDGCFDWQDLLSLYKHTADAEIANARSVFTTSIAPIDPYTLRSIDSLVMATRVKDLLFHALPSRKFLSLTRYIPGFPAVSLARRRSERYRLKGWSVIKAIGEMFLAAATERVSPSP